MGPGQVAQALQESGGRGDQAHVPGHGFEDHRGDARTLLGQQALDGLGVVVGQGQRLPGQACGHTGRVGDPEGGGARAGLDQQAVAMPVVAAIELDDPVAAGAASGQAQGAHGGLSPRGDQAHPLHGGDVSTDQPDQFDLRFAGGPEGQAPARRLAHGLDHLRVGVTQDQGAPGTDQVQVGVAVDVGDAGTLGAGEDQGLAPHGAEGAHGAGDASGHEVAGLGEEGCGTSVGGGNGEDLQGFRGRSTAREDLLRRSLPGTPVPAGVLPNTPVLARGVLPNTPQGPA